jgi:hypothetical protein
MQAFSFNPVELDLKTRKFYQHVLKVLLDADLPFVIGGSYCLEAYTGNGRHTKDLDVFVRSSDCPRVFQTLAAAGYATEIVFPHWLGKVYYEDDFIDIIFSSGNGLCPVDDTWFDHAIDGEILQQPVKLAPIEEIIWQKAFIMERERFDGADVAHLLRVWAKDLDWKRLLERFGPHWRVLLAHLILFGYIYPAHRAEIPESVMHELDRRLQTEINEPALSDLLCQGTLLSRAQYLTDLEHWGYEDARLRPRGALTREEVQRWTEPIQDQDRPLRRSTPLSSANAVQG